MNPGLKRLPSTLLSLRCRTRAGLKGLDLGDRKGFPGRLECPWCDRFGHELWEVRSKLPRGRITRGIEQGSMVLLHGFMKKSQKTPQQEIDLALKRKRGTSI